MIMYKDRFKKFGGEYIPDIIQYLVDVAKEDPTLTITVGCDSIQARRKTIYAVTVMMYNTDIRKGAHVVFFRENCPKIRENAERLYKEAQYVHDVAMFLHENLSGVYERKDLTDFNRKKYKFHLLRCNGEYEHVPPHQEEAFINRLSLSPEDLAEFKLVDIHVDFNPKEGTPNGRGMTKNKSYAAYKAYSPWLRGLGFRTWAKPDAPGASTAADLLLQE
jgi:predicted RNase H-related nuclease YkuK (DUF458 family)